MGLRINREGTYYQTYTSKLDKQCNGCGAQIPAGTLYARTFEHEAVPGTNMHKTAGTFCDRCFYRCHVCNTALFEERPELTCNHCHEHKKQAVDTATGKNKVKRKEKGPVTLMEPHLDGSWHEVTVEKFYWQCALCGLVWGTRGEAESCAAHKHASSHRRYYGGWFENGVHRGGAHYDIQAIYRGPIAGARKQQEETENKVKPRVEA